MYAGYLRHKSIYNILLFLSAAGPLLILAFGPCRSDNAADVLFPVLVCAGPVAAGFYFIFRKEMVGIVLERFKVYDTILTLISALLIILFLGQRVYKTLGCLPAYVIAQLLTVFPSVLFILAYTGIKTVNYLGNNSVSPRNFKRLSRIKLLIAFITIILIQFILYYQRSPDAFNITVLAFSYDFGFISRGFIGTIIRLLSGNKVTLELILMINLIGFMLWVGILISLFMFLIKRAVSPAAKRSIALLSLIFALGFGFSTYIRDFGRLDIYLMILSSAACMLILKNKAVYLAVPLSLIAVLIHQGYVSMYFNLLLALLFYKGFIIKESRKKHTLILLSSLIMCLALFTYLQVYSHAKEGLTLKQIEAYISTITGPSGVRTDIIRQELFKEAVTFTAGSIYELPFAVLLLCPCLVFLINIWRDIITSVKGRKRKLLYSLLPLGALTLLPLFIFATDRGRWTYALFFYELLFPLMLTASGDETAEAAVSRAVAKLTVRPGISILAFTYVLILGPFHVININGLSGWLSSIIA